MYTTLKPSIIFFTVISALNSDWVYPFSLFICANAIAYFLLLFLTKEVNFAVLTTFLKLDIVFALIFEVFGGLQLTYTDFILLFLLIVPSLKMAKFGKSKNFAKTISIGILAATMLGISAALSKQCFNNLQEYTSITSHALHIIFVLLRVMVISVLLVCLKFTTLRDHVRPLLVGKNVRSAIGTGLCASSASIALTAAYALAPAATLVLAVGQMEAMVGILISKMIGEKLCRTQYASIFITALCLITLTIYQFTKA